MTGPERARDRRAEEEGEPRGPAAGDGTDEADRGQAADGPRGEDAEPDGADASRRDDAAAEDEGRIRLSLRKVRRILGGLPRFGKLLYRLLNDARVSLLDKVIFGAALVYLFVPVDLVPDWLPGLGQMDDLLVVLFTLDRLLHRTDEAVLAEHWEGDAASLAALVDLLERTAGVLPGWARTLLRAG